jgi:hypothetical protein
MTLEEAFVIPRQLSRVFLCLLIVVAVVPSAWSQTPSVDPQSLIGQWSGSWTGTHGGAGRGSGSGKYYLTIERVEGEKVYAKQETSSKRGNVNSVTGRLSGNLLTFGKTELTIDGKNMQGTAPDMKISLTKE